MYSLVFHEHEHEHKNGHECKKNKMNIDTDMDKDRELNMDHDTDMDKDIVIEKTIFILFSFGGNYFIFGYKLQLKGIVRRKLRWVKSGINQ